MRRLGSLGLVTGIAGLVAMVVVGGAALAADARVAVLDNRFEPRQVTINVGDAVTWEFDGNAPHSVTADDGSFDSHPQCSGSNIVGCSSPASPPFERTFSSAGTFAYHCKIHGAPGGGGMAGVVVVNAPGGGTAPTTAPPTTAAPSSTTTTRSAARQTTTTEALATSTSVDDTSTTTSSVTSTSTSTTVELTADTASDDDGGGVAAGWIVLGVLLAAGAAGGASYAIYQLIQSRRAGVG